MEPPVRRDFKGHRVNKVFPAPKELKVHKDPLGQMALVKQWRVLPVLRAILVRRVPKALKVHREFQERRATPETQG